MEISSFDEMNHRINKIFSEYDMSVSTYENDLRAAKIEEKLKGAPTPNDLFFYAREKLNGGDTEVAISTIEKLMSDVESLKTINSQSKPFYEFLAISYLRKAEQENCQMNHNDESCIVPIQQKGIHTEKDGSQKAIGIYKKLLQVFPNDMQSRWLLNIAYMTLDLYPEGVPEPLLIPIAQPTASKHFSNIGTQLGIDWFSLSGGSISDDFDNDGWIDLIVSSWGTSGKVKYYRNNTNGGFEDYTERSGLDKAHGGLNMVQTDYNNDGFMDFYIMRSGWMPNVEWGIMPNSLIKNNGDGTFQDVTISTGLYSLTPSQSVIWRDFDNNGFLDLFVVNETSRQSKTAFPCQLFMNYEGVFNNEAKQWGVDFVGYFKSANSGDVNNDGWQDIYIANLDGDNKMLYNNVKGGAFQGFIDISNKTKTTLPNASFSSWFFDYNNDGLEDIYVCSYDRTALEDQGGEFARNQLKLSRKGEDNCLYRNNGDGTFSNVTDELFESGALATMGCNIGDINNDGYIDFYLGTGAPDYRSVVPNRLFENRQGKSFKDVTFEQGLGHIQKGHGISFADFNNDGSQDIHAVMGGAFKGDLFPNALFENQPSENKWIKLKLKGIQSNRSAIGAKIRLEILLNSGAKQRIYYNVNSGASFGANPILAEIGLGDANEILRLEVKWPNKENKWVSYEGFSLNKKYEISEDNKVLEIELQNVLFDKSNSNSHQHHQH